MVTARTERTAPCAPDRFRHGDRVKLTDRLAHALMDWPSRAKVDWLTRRGTVMNCSVSTVYVQWDGLKALDPVPVKGVERVPEETQ